MFNGSISVPVGDVVDSGASRGEAVGDIYEDAETMTEIPGIVVQELSSGDIGEFNIEMVPFNLLSWREYSSDDITVDDGVGHFHLIVKEFKNRCFHGFIIIGYGVLFFQIIKINFSDCGEANGALGITNNRSKIRESILTRS